MKRHIRISFLSFFITLLLPAIAYAGGFKDLLGYSLGAIVGLLVFVIAWVIFPYTLGQFKMFRASPSGLFGAKIMQSFLFGLSAFFVLFCFVTGHKPFQKPEVQPITGVIQKSEVKTNGTGKLEMAYGEKPNEEEKPFVMEKQPDKEPAIQAEPSNTFQFPANGQISASNVNIRSSHSIFADRVATLPKGQNVTVLDSWVSDSDKEAILRNDLQVEIGGQTKTIGKGKAVTIVQYEPSQKKFLVSWQDKSGAINAWISEENVKSLKGLAWYKVSTSAGKTGWVLGEFLSIKR